ncbi:MAG: hypothetical protein ACI843_003030 [Psychrobacter glaciei]|jgi:hypothetical protein
MNQSIKSNSLYYFCQLVGTILFWGVIILIGLSQKSFEDIPIFGFIESIILTILLSHFILRKKIKANSSHNYFNIKAYALAILIASIVFFSIVKMNDILFSFLDETDSSVKDVGLLAEFGSGVSASILIFTVWCVLYISITSIRDKKTLAQQLKEQQLSSLMNQVNPHFLFNSLNTIRGMIYEDQDKAAELVTHLANLFRYNLSLDTKATMNLVDELHICQQYLAIESIRLGSRLDLDINIAPECHTAKIPSMGLLTLVENAIKHGISHLQQGGVLTIKAIDSGEGTVIDVINPFDKSLVRSGTQVGLANLQQRMALLFSEQASLSHHACNNIFHVTLNLPYESANHD